MATGPHGDSSALAQLLVVEELTTEREPVPILLLQTVDRTVTALLARVKLATLKLALPLLLSQLLNLLLLPLHLFQVKIILYFSRKQEKHFLVIVLRMRL